MSDKVNSIEERAIAEAERLRRLLFDCGVSEKRMELLAPLIENTAWMKVKLDEAREAVKTSNVVIRYDNGGGQSGLRENPLFKGYEALWKSYMNGFSKLLEFVPKEVVEKEAAGVEHPKTVLEIVRAKHRKEA